MAITLTLLEVVKTLLSDLEWWLISICSVEFSHREKWKKDWLCKCLDDALARRITMTAIISTNFADIFADINFLSFWPQFTSTILSILVVFYCGKSTFHMCKCTHIYIGGGVWLPGLILGLHPSNERRRYIVTKSLIGWAQT